MTLQQMEYIVAVDKYRHFVRAAESCGVTQSTLSSLISKLEAELDVTIFDRTSHPVKPTVLGEEIISQAQAAAAQIKSKASADIEMEKKKAINDAKNEISGLAMAIAGKVVERELNTADQADLIDRFINELGDGV